MEYAIGSSVEIEYKVRDYYLYAKEQYAIRTRKGIVAKTPSWVEYPAVAIRTSDPDFPLAIIPLSSIVGYQKEQDNNEYRAYTVGKYLVTKVNKQVSCTCVGFQFRRYCKHSDQYKDR